MSGGSYDYFYSRAPEHLRKLSDDLKHMADRCDRRAEGQELRHWKTNELLALSELAECATASWSATRAC